MSGCISGQICLPLVFIGIHVIKTHLCGSVYGSESHSMDILEIKITAYSLTDQTSRVKGQINGDQAENRRIFSRSGSSKKPKAKVNRNYK